MAFQDATAVFTGEVTSITEAPFHQGDNFHQLLVHFSVQQAYKGNATSETTVATWTGTDCDFDFQKGERYFVYAYADSQNNRLATGVCTRTELLRYAGADLDYAQGIATSAPQPAILGADRGYSSLLQGADIIAEGEGQKYRAKLDERGAFKITLARPGKYKVTVIGLPGYVFLNQLKSWKVFFIGKRPAAEFEIEIQQGECGFVDFSDYLDVQKR